MLALPQSDNAYYKLGTCNLYDMLWCTSEASVEMVVGVYSGAHPFRSGQQHADTQTLSRSALLCWSGDPSECSKSTSTPSYVGRFTGATVGRSACVALVKSSRSVAVKQG